MKAITLKLISAALLIIVIQTAASDRVDSTAIVLKEIQPQAIHPRVEQAVTFLLTKNHYKKRKINDDLSSEMFDFYIDLLDHNKLYFLQSDIDEFEQYRYRLDDGLRRGDLEAAYRIFNRFQSRLAQRHSFVQRRLAEPFDFTIDEYFNLDREKAPWAQSQAQLDSIWRKRLKDEVLRLKLAGKKDNKISEMLEKRYKNILHRVAQTKSEDVFQYYMNAFAETFDPHTSYMSPKASDDFSIRMSLSLEGIGASLQTEDEYTKVVRIIPGGPADRSGLLHANDRITAVGQGDNGELVDVVGWRIDDVVDLIRGPKDTKVKLQILPAESPVTAVQDTIELIRDKVKLADSAAKSDTLDIEYQGQSFRFGVIEIPDFYLDYEARQQGDPNYASTSRDVKRLLRELQGAGVDGIIIDLRRNGGGFLTEAVELSGLFIKDGPVVQVRDMFGRVKKEEDDDPGVYYDGPLAVLVNRLSASASEIFAAAIQDYGRGIIVGDQTYGKGTVQNILKLNRMFPRSKEKMGQVKLTIAKFYRVNGGSTQHIGVIPDINFPSRYQVMEIGESNQENALLWDEIEPAEFTPYGNQIKELLPRLKSLHQARVSQNSEFRYLLEDIERLRQNREHNVVSLQEEKRKEERDKAEARKKKRKEEREKNGNDGKEDLLVAETAHILSDLILLTR